MKSLIWDSKLLCPLIFSLGGKAGKARSYPYDILQENAHQRLGSTVSKFSCLLIRSKTLIFAFYTCTDKISVTSADEHIYHQMEYEHIKKI